MTEILAGLTQSAPNGRARAAAFATAGDAQVASTSLVGYRSTGRLLILGPPEAAFASADGLREQLDCVVVSEGQTDRKAPGVVAIDAPVIGLSGHLGAFDAKVETPRGEVSLSELFPDRKPGFDLVLDLHTPPLLAQEIPPVGYYAPDGDADALQGALQELPEMRGEFEKPKFFSYNPDICAHGNSGLQGCTRCLEVCPTQAITSLVDRIEVDPYLCQGAGSCATACPSGAITYAYPNTDDLLSRIRGLLGAYREAGGERASVLFHDAESGAQWVAQHAGALPESMFPVELAEIGSAGMEVWLSALAYGARPVLLLRTAQTAPSVVRELEAQIDYTRAILAGLGYPRDAVRLIDKFPETDDTAAESAPAAKFAALGSKREVFRFALQHLHQYAPVPEEVVELPSGAPFGEIEVDREACTLCMACVSVCPASALQDGTEHPLLSFKESKCVQCGLCAQACPEQAIQLRPRMAYAAHLQPDGRVLNEDAPFDCIVCGKPFATQKIMERIAGKLSGHWMFQNQQALDRLRMCEDCRVHDIFAGSGGLEVYDKRP